MQVSTLKSAFPCLRVSYIVYWCCEISDCMGYYFPASERKSKYIYIYYLGFPFLGLGRAAALFRQN